MASMASPVALGFFPLNRFKVSLYVALYHFTNATGGSSDNFDSKLFKVARCAWSQAPGKHGISPLRMNPVWKVARAVACKGNIKDLTALDPTILHTDERIMLRPAKMLLNPVF
jgi:hypothetical protein